MEKLVYLKKYSEDIELIDFFTLSKEESKNLPQYWIKLLQIDSQKEKKNILLNEWKKFDYQFHSTIDYLENNLIDIDLVFYNNNYSLLYSILNSNNEIVYYEGRNPLTKNIPENIFHIWNEIPPTFLQIYEELHNGWVYFASQSNGLYPIEDVVILGDNDWGILDEIDINTLSFKLENCLGFFSNGMGDYACIDIKDKNPKKGFIWWNKKQPKTNIEIWPVIDEWTKIGIEK